MQFNEYVIDHKLIKGQRVKIENGHYIQYGPTYGPFYTPTEAANNLNINSKSKVNEILKGRKRSIQGYPFWYEGAEQYRFRIPIVIKNPNEVKVKKHTAETIVNTLKSHGFDVTAISTLKETETRVTVRYCRVGCSGICERTLKDFISDEVLPLCDFCLNIWKVSEPATNNHSYLHEIRPELANYYDEHKNKGIPFESWKKGSKTKIYLTCPQCLTTQNDTSATTPNKYTSKKNNGQFYANFVCAACNSLVKKYPIIAEEWDLELNGPLPKYLSYASNKVYSWRCKNGHAWQTAVYSRTQSESGCPICFLKQQDSKIGQLMKQTITYFKGQTVVFEEAVPNTSYRNDCVVILKTGKRIAFEMQGNYWHYTERKLLRMDNDLMHKDNIKIAANRANGDFVFLLNEYDFNNEKVIICGSQLMTYGRI